MKTQNLLIVSLAFAIGITVASLVILNRRTQPAPANPPLITTVPSVVQHTPSVTVPTTVPMPVVQMPKTAVPTDTKPQKISSLAVQTPDASQPLTINGYVVQDPMARTALSYVGADPDATQYWTDAIHDSSLPPEERKDLIEDLNEDGLSDPKNPGVQDVPLIVSRIQLIQQLAANETDPVNINAFAEAYKDLNDMLAGKPVQ